MEHIKGYLTALGDGAIYIIFFLVLLTVVLSPFILWALHLKVLAIVIGISVDLPLFGVLMAN